jgi:hypothetical protein
MNDVESIDSIEAVVSDYYCVRKMVKVIKDHAGTDEGKDVSRILNRYIITSKSLGNDSHAIIPEFIHGESVEKFNSELLEKFPNINLEDLHTGLAEVRDIYLGKKHFDRGKLKHPKEERYTKASEDKEHMVMIIDYEFTPGKSKNSFDARVPKHIYDKLVESCEEQSHVHKYIYMTYMRYHIITCGGKDPTQWACSEDIIDILSEELHCNIELFASPINRNPRIPLYGSLFHDTDHHFGSIGSYVGIIAEKRLSGFIQAHPPAIEMIIDDFTTRSLAEMQLEDRELGFVILLPYWKDSNFYRMLVESKYCRRTVLASDYLNSEDEDLEELAEPYFTYYSPLLDEDIPLNEDRDISIIVVLANDTLWNSEIQDIIDEHFPTCV